MDNTELTPDVENAIAEAKFIIVAAESSIMEVEKKMAAITKSVDKTKKNDNATKKSLEKTLDDLKALYLQLEDQKTRYKKILSDYGLELAKLEREVNNRPD